eukprot:6122238-Ditylum_brightwellii.AAC.1
MVDTVDNIDHPMLKHTKEELNHDTKQKVPFVTPTSSDDEDDDFDTSHENEVNNGGDIAVTDDVVEMNEDGN